MSLRVGDRVERRSGGAGAWGEGFVTQVGSTSSRLCDPALLVTVSSTNPNAMGYTWDEVRPLPLHGGAQIIDEPEDVEAEMARLKADAAEQRVAKGLEELKVVLEAALAKRKLVTQKNQLLLK